jgi:hypothetical protein
MNSPKNSPAGEFMTLFQRRANDFLCETSLELTTRSLGILILAGQTLSKSERGYLRETWSDLDASRLIRAPPLERSEINKILWHVAVEKSVSLILQNINQRS